MRIDPNGNDWWNPFSWDENTWQNIGKVALLVTTIVVVTAAAVLTVGGFAIILGLSTTVTHAVALSALTGALISGGVNAASQLAYKGFEGLDVGELCASTYVGGLVSGASAGFGKITSLNRLAQIGINMGLSAVGYLLQSAMVNPTGTVDSKFLEGLGFSMISGGISGSVYDLSTVKATILSIGLEAAASHRILTDAFYYRRLDELFS
jgi:hypothetical protein